MNSYKIVIPVEVRGVGATELGATELGEGIQPDVLVLDIEAPNATDAVTNVIRILNLVARQDPHEVEVSVIKGKLGL